MRAPIIIVTGSPGAGKSTVASLVAESFDQSAVITGDHFHNYLRRGKIPPWLPESHQQNTMITDVTMAAVASYAAGGWTTVLEGIFGPWFFPAITAGLAGATVHYLVLDVPLETCLQRFSQREPGESTEVVSKMHGEFARASIDPRHLVSSNGDPETVAAAILDRVAAGTAALAVDD